jgi:hypothetical protein
MPANYVLLEKITVGAAGAASVTFSGIPQTGYTDLVVKASTRASDSNASYGSVVFKPNNLTATAVRVAGDGSGTFSNTNVNTESSGNLATANTFGSIDYYITNYTSSAFKSASIDWTGENNATTNYTGLSAHLISTTSPITSIVITSSTYNFGQYSTFYLYGVAKLGTTPAIVPYATGGNTIMTDGTYWYHAFLSSGTFTPQKGISCDVLVVAGGAGAGSGNSGGLTAGGGGAGGLVYSASNAISTAQTVTIGAGGAQAVNGSNSVFGSTTATGGGTGGAGTNGAGVAGGSGGGAEGSGAVGAASPAGQGNAGGTGYALSGNAGGGGGGAGAVGGNAAAGSAGNGGAGINTYSSWLSTTGLGVSGYIAGGGAGGLYYTAGTGSNSSGGSGGGGRGGTYWSGATQQTPTAGTANTGGGGGGYGLGAGSESGGSGLVIVRYAV